jgi:hypothetical protein
MATLQFSSTFRQVRASETELQVVSKTSTERRRQRPIAVDSDRLSEVGHRRQVESPGTAMLTDISGR